MRIVITGGLGMLGIELARHLRRARPLAVAPPDDLAGVLELRGDIRDAALLRTALDSPEVAVVHLASIVSGGAERDFDLALDVNLDGGRALVQACREHRGAPRVVFTSSLATFGGELALGTVDDGTRQTPLTTYGATKAMLELLFADATRKGFLDARSARPPTVIVRPGAPNAAASGFASAVVREPLAGRPTTLPVALDQPAVVIGVDTTVACLARLLEIDGDELGDGRALNLPGLVVTSAELLNALHSLVDEETLAPVSVEIDPATEAIVRTWATDWRSSRADALGLPRDEDAAGKVRAYLARIGTANDCICRVAMAALGACARQSGAELTYPFGEQAAVFKVAGKIFAIVGLERTPPQITLKCEPEHAELLRAEHAAIAAGYHMNKRHWITVTLDGSLAPTMIEELIEDSFDLVAPPVGR